MPSLPDPAAAIRLQGGESLFVYLKAASIITSTSGQLRVEGAPDWIGGQVFRAGTRLAEGEVWLSHERGWVTLTAAASGSTVHICRDLRRAPAASPLMEWLRKTAGMLIHGRATRRCA